MTCLKQETEHLHPTPAQKTGSGKPSPEEERIGSVHSSHERSWQIRKKIWTRLGILTHHPTDSNLVQISRATTIRKVYRTREMATLRFRPPSKHRLYLYRSQMALAAASWVLFPNPQGHTQVTGYWATSVSHHRWGPGTALRLSSLMVPKETPCNASELQFHIRASWTASGQWALPHHLMRSSMPQITAGTGDRVHL